MKNILLDIIEKYLQIFSEEHRIQLKLIEFLNKNEDKSVTDWNNFDGHIVASGFIYAKDKNKFLVLYHKDLELYMYPGGHIDYSDKSPLEAAKREILEETGLYELKQLKVCNWELVPIDIDTHMIGYNKRLGLPKHYHFDFRYLFIVDKIKNINVDKKELDNYKLIDIKELSDNPNYGKIGLKIKKILQKIIKDSEGIDE